MGKTNNCPLPLEATPEACLWVGHLLSSLQLSLLLQHLGAAARQALGFPGAVGSGAFVGGVRKARVRWGSWRHGRCCAGCLLVHGGSPLLAEVGTAADSVGETPLPWPAPGDPLGLGEGGGGGAGCCLAGPPLQCRSWEVSRIGATLPPTHQALGPPQWPFSELVLGGGPRGWG